MTFFSLGRVLKQTASVLVLGAFSSLALATTPSEALKELLDGYQRFSADFEQVTLSEGKPGEVNRGSLLVAKPNRFRWETREPFPQTIVSDGSYLWIYDPDLEQATRKPVDNQVNGAAMILNGDVDALAQRFRILMPSSQEGEQLFELLPLEEGGNFQKMRLFFANGVMQELMLEDLLGQRTTILFRDATINPSVESGSFSFSAPEGTDIIISDGV